MHDYSALCDDYYLNLNLATEMELPGNRETILHYFEQLQKKYPTMRKFYSRERKDYVLEEDKEQGHYRWSTVETRRVCSGYVNPSSPESALEQHRFVLETIPYALSISPLEVEALDVLYGFDFSYRGNQNLLLAETLGFCPAYEKLLDLPGAKVINYEPVVTLAVEDDCRTQVRMSIETRTTAAQVRSGDFPEDQFSVYLTARQYGSLAPGVTFLQTMEKLAELAASIVQSHVRPNVLEPLARAISMK